MSVGLGALWAVLAAFANGTFGVFSKARSVVEGQVHPIVFNWWVAVGVILSSAPFVFHEKFIFTWWGLVSGFLFVFSTANAFAAFKALGLSVGLGVLCGTSVLASFTFGVRFSGETIHHPGLAAPALILLVGGVAGLAINGTLCSSAEDDAGTREALMDHEERESQPRVPEVIYPQFVKGLSAAITAGVFGGLVLAPMSCAPPMAQGLQFIPSMAAGIILAAPVVTYTAMLILKIPICLEGRRAGIPGMLAGCVWQVGNLCSILATKDPSVGLSIAYPIMQCGLFVGGLWGICLFKELKGRGQVGYWISGAVLILGASMLAVSK
ncbi:hypothetical protein WJX84_010380 [Apatococcus fuscideae]|uniref:Uncharacterized protein n=1 Tax=Apatococcus fuscideae TaxID=2026836 RepID=A0AAW1T699_9CHLO